MNTRKVIDYITHEITHKTGGLNGTMQHRQRQKKLIILPTDPSTQWTTTKQKKTEKITLQLGKQLKMI